MSRFATSRSRESQLALVCYALTLLCLVLGHTKFQYLSAISGTFVTYGKFIPVFISLVVVFVGIVSHLLEERVSNVALTCVFGISACWGFFHGEVDYTIFFILYYAIACRNCEIELIFKAYSIVVFSIIAMTIIASHIGILPNTIDNYGRHDLGFTFATFGPNLFLSACLSLVAWKKENLPGWGWIAILVVNQYFYIRTGTLAVYLCVLLSFALFVLCKHTAFKLRVNRNIVIRFCMSNAFLICAVLTLALQIVYNLYFDTPAMAWLNSALNTRLELGRHNFLMYTQDSAIYQILLGLGPGGYRYVDSSYEQILFVYGAIVLLFICFAMRIIMRYSIESNSIYLSLGLLIFALHCCSDPQLLSFRCDPFIITILICALEKRRIEHSPTTNLSGLYVLNTYTQEKRRRANQHAS